MRIFRRGKGRIWWMEYRDPVNGREVRQSLRVTSRRVAEHLKREIAEQIARRHYRLAERKPWRDAVAAYLAHAEIYKEPVTVAKDRRTLTKHLVPPDVVQYLDELRPDHIAAYVRERQGLGLSPSTVNRELRTIRAFLNWSARPSRGWITDNPAREVPMFREPQGVAARAMTDNEIALLLQEIEGTRLEGPVLMAINHGLREGELIHMRRDAVDLVGAKLYIRHDPLTRWKVKEGRERVVHLNEVTRTWLARYLAHPARALSLYLFPSDFGRPQSREALVMAMGRVMRRIGIARGGFHMLRHTWATRQAEAGTPIPVIKAMGGWRDWRSMERYQHIGDEAQRHAAERVSISLHKPKVLPLRRKRVQP